ncbi:MAG TPA: cyclic nucleotide-binding domain-containing protein [Acidimicrobiia bacterium]|nr:cyclic nucleotide-binding domain-containing protein [Acidimicrobiia bacterium]
MDTAVKGEDLTRVPLFEGLGSYALNEIADQAVKTYVRPHMALAKQGDQGFGFAVILSGHAEVRVNGNVVATLGPGDVFGEMSLATGAPRSADVVSTEQMSVAHFMVWDFRSIVDKHPEVKTRIDQMVADRSG